MQFKKIFKVTDSISRRLGYPAVYIDDLLYYADIPAGLTPGIAPGAWVGVQDQIDEIADGDYYTEYVFDQWQDMTTSAPFYFYWEIPFGTVEIISARVSFEVKSGTGTIDFTISEDKGCLYGDNYGPYETDMRAIDISGDLTGEGIKIIKLTTSANVTLTARVFLKVKISKKETPEGWDTYFNQRPEVKTLAATSIIDVSATLNGDIVKTGTLHAVNRSTGEIELINECTKRGFKYGLTKIDTWDTNESGNFVKGTYGLEITGLTPATDYYFRAYAKNSVGISYGEYMKLTTLAAIPEIFVVYDSGGTYYIKSYNVNGTLCDTWTIETTENVGNAMAVDADGNVYTIGGNQHDIRKRNSDGNVVLHKVENTNYIYNIAAGPDGYIYTQEYDGSISKLSKRNASNLVSVGTKNLTSGNTYYGMAIDSDGDFYLMNDNTSKYERWDWSAGKVSDVTALHTTFNSLGVVGTKLADVHWLSHALTRLKDLSGTETDVDLTSLTKPGAVGSTGTHFLFAGYNVDNDVTLGKYDASLTKVWATVVLDGGNYGSIASYPF